MAQYIDKSALVAEIERRIQELRPTNTHKMQVGEKMDRDVLMWLNALTWVKKVIDTFETKEVDLDDDVDNILEANDWNYDKIDFYDFARHFFELGLNSKTKDIQDALRMEYEKGRADVIAKTLEWINVFNDNNYIMQYSDSCEHPINEIIEWYKNYINRE